MSESPRPEPVWLDEAINSKLTSLERNEVLKKAITLRFDEIKQQHREGQGGLDNCRNRAETIDSLLQLIFQINLKALNLGEPKIALVAVGGYGRGTLNPGSDIDLLFLLPQNSTKLQKIEQELVQTILYVLWDLGFKLGHSCRSVAECIQQAHADPHNLTALLDSRLIAGNLNLFHKLLETFHKNCVAKGQDAFFKSRRTDIRSRHQKSSHTVFLQEPNVKESCGGLRDYQNMLWIGRVKAGAKDLQQLADEKIITLDTLREIEEAYDFIMRVRNELHYHSGKATDILTLQLQGIVATAFGYPQRSILRRTEFFMRDYYRHTRHIYQHTTSLMETFQIQNEETAEMGLKSFLTFRKNKREIFDGFISKEGRIFPQNDNIFKDDIFRLMRLFQHCQLRNLKLSPPMRRLVANHWDDIDRTFRYNKANRDTFQAILERKGEVALTLRQMHRIGFLGRYLPEFGALDCLVQHEFFHRYTADEHTLRCIDELDRLVGDVPPKLEVFRNLFHEIGDSYALYLALILHDTGRSENVREHIDGSTMLATKLCSRMQIHGSRRALIMFLVDNHLTFWRTATTRNLEDPEVISEFARIMKTPENLDALLLFTYCDTNGTAPDAWNGWKESLMLQLHKATHRFLAEGKEGFTRKLDDERELLKDEIMREMPEQYAAQIHEHFSLTPATAFAYREAPYVITQIKAIHDFIALENVSDKAEAFQIRWLNYPDKGYSELFLATRNRPLLLEKLCCALASEEINILSADLFTRADEIVVNIFRVCSTNFEPIKSESTRRRFKEILEAIYFLDEYHPENYLRRKTNFLKPRTETGIPVPVRAYVSNKILPPYTTVEIQALDRIGLLHDLFHAINEAGFDTHHARICTEKGVAMDTLYIITRDGENITDEAKLVALNEKFNSLISNTENH